MKAVTAMIYTEGDPVVVINTHYTTELPDYTQAIVTRVHWEEDVDEAAMYTIRVLVGEERGAIYRIHPKDLVSAAFYDCQVARKVLIDALTDHYLDLYNQAPTMTAKKKVKAAWKAKYKTI
jgi:hypothetical protein